MDCRTRPLRAVLPLLAALAVARSGSLRAQQATDDLGFQGTMALNATWNTASTGVVFPNSITGLRSGEQRYSGRAALRIAVGLYAGASVSSWQFDFIRFTGSAAIDAVSDGVNVSPYLQLYPVRHANVFIRAGIGYVRTWAYNGSGYIIEGFKGSHLTGSAGMGADISLRPHLALTLSADYTNVFGATNYAEAQSAIMAGVGLTVR